MERGVPIRSISRAITVLQVINRAPSISMMEIARGSGMPYPTACRIVQTLLHEGLIEREPARKRYRATVLVQTLSHGFQSHDHLAQVARPHLAEYTRKVGWPIALCTRVGQSMVVRTSTHANAAKTLTIYHAGYSLPLLGSAAGRTHIAFASEEEQADILATLDLPPNDPEAATLQLFRAGGLIEEIRAAGYALKGRNQHTATPGKTSSISVPVLDGDELQGVIALIYFSSAMRSARAVAEFAEPLKQVADDIARDLRREAQPARSQRVPADDGAHHAVKPA